MNFTVTNVPRHRMNTIASHTVVGIWVCLFCFVVAGIVSPVRAQVKRVPQTQLIPNDSLYSRQWYAQRLGLERAWDVSVGSTSVTIAIIAEGFDLNHPDLRNAWFTNTADPIDGIDNDRNGYIDDNRGWDFVGNVDAQTASLGVYSEDNNPMQPNANIVNGTHLAGIIAGRHDNGGIAGIAPNCRILPIKIANDDRSVPFITRLADAITYSARMGARVILIGTASYNEIENGGFDANEQRAITEAIGTASDLGAVVICPAGEAPSGSTLPLRGDNFSYPASYQNVLAIGASGFDDRPVATSLVGTKMSLYAPGENILSTVPGGYAVLSGSRQSAAIAAGVAGLVISQTPSLSARAVIAELRATSDNVLQGGAVSASVERSQQFYGRISAINAVTQTVPNMGLNAVNPLLLLDPTTLVPMTTLTNGQTALVNFRIKNYATQAQGSARNVRITLQPLPNTPLVTEVGNPATASYAEMGAGQVVSAGFRLRLTGEAFRTTAQSADILVNIVADGYRETFVASIPFVVSPTDVINVVVPAHIDMGSGVNGQLQRDVTLVNGSNERVTVNGILLSGANVSEFQIVQVNGRAPVYPLVIDSGAVANVRLRYTTTATTSGQRVAQLNVRSSSPVIGDTLYTGRITAVVQPGAMVVTQASMIASTGVGSTSGYTLSLQNSGSQSLTNVRATLVSTATGSVSEFSTSATTLLGEVRGGASAVWQGRFAPAQAGQRNVVLRITADNVPTIDYPLSGIGLQPNGAILVRMSNGVANPLTTDDVVMIDSARIGGSKTLTTLAVMNTALTPVQVTLPVFSGIGAQEMSATLGTSTEASVLVPAGASIPLTIRFTAQSSGEKYVRMSARTLNGSTATIIGETTVISRGTPPQVLLTELRTPEDIIASRYGEPVYSLVPVTLFLGADTVQTNLPSVTPRNTPQRFGLAVRNSGTAPLVLNTLAVSNTAFQVITRFPKTLSAGQSDTVSVVFTPTVLGSTSGQCILTASTNNITLRDTVMVTGVGAQSALIVAGTNDGALSSYQTSFTTTRVGSSVSTSIPIANRGTASGAVVVRMSGRDSSEFSVVRPFGRYAIDTRTNDSINVRFIPRTPGLKDAFVMVDLPDGSVLRFPVLARAVPIPRLITSFNGTPVSALNFGAVEEEDTSRRVIQIRGTDLTEPIAVSLAGHPAVYVPFDTSKFARGRTYFPDDNGGVNDSLVVMVNPIRQPDTLAATLTAQMNDIANTIQIGAVSIPFTKPVLRLPFAMTFDTVQTNITYLRSFGILAANLTNDINVILPPGFEIRTEEGDVILSSSGTIRRWAPRMDSVLALAFTPRVAVGDYVDSIRFSSVISGTGATAVVLRNAIPLTARVIPQPIITASVTTATVPDIPIRRTTQTTITVNFISMATGSTVTVDMFDGDPRFILLDNAGRDAGGALGFQLPAGATMFSTNVTIRFAPDSASTFTSSLRYSGVSVNGDTLAGFTTITGRGLPIPTLLASTQGVEFGTVRIFSNTPRILQVTASTITDTLRVRMMSVSTNASPSPFSVQIEDQRYVRNFALAPNEFGRIDTTIVVWFEPFETGRYTDTLFFESREIGSYWVIVGGTVSTATSVRVVNDGSIARIVPSVVQDEAFFEINPTLQGLSAIASQLEIIDAMGTLRKRVPLSVLAGMPQRVQINVKDLPSGAYMWRYAMESKAGRVLVTGKFIVIR